MGYDQEPVWLAAAQAARTDTIPLGHQATSMGNEPTNMGDHPTNVVI